MPTALAWAKMIFLCVASASITGPEVVTELPADNHTAMAETVTLSDFDQAIQRAGYHCQQTMLAQPYPSDGRLYCNATFDGWGCWNYTLAGSRAYIQCPSFKEGFDPRLTAYRDCTKDGTWWMIPEKNRTWSNYTTCVNIGELAKDKRLIHMWVAGYTISIIALFISLIIFFHFRQLQCDRVTLHKNLFFSYILNGIAWILYYTLAALNASVITANPIWCQAIHVVTQYLVTCNFFWMFCEGLYLHTIIVSAFITGKKLLIACFIIGWGGPILTTVVYTSIRANSPTETAKCWLIESSLQWIVFGPIVITILTNLIFLCNIVRVLITKLRAVNSPDTNQSRKAVRATLILIPLLGLQYILFPLQPQKGTVWEEIYLMGSAFVTSFQGFFVALIFCFCNGEVISVIKRKWGQHRLMTGGCRSTLYTQTTISVADAHSVAPTTIYEVKRHNHGGGGESNKSSTQNFKNHHSPNGIDDESSYPLKDYPNHTGRPDSPI